MERDNGIILTNVIDMGISTHTLTWSVTGIIEIACVVLVNFNSHAHVERDIPRRAGTAIVFNFNSHAHVERDVKLL